MPQSAYVRVERGAEVISAPFHASADRRSLLDRAHRGDIEGALGNLHSFDTGPRRTLRRRLATLLAITWRGVLAMISDYDAGSVSLYGHAGQNYGLKRICLMLLPARVLAANQELVD